jgi:N-carbamoyl-L-amino-acid hydrolase
MLFIPCKEGRSHCPEEWAELEHIGYGVDVLANTIMTIDKE